MPFFCHSGHFGPTGGATDATDDDRVGGHDHEQDGGGDNNDVDDHVDCHVNDQDDGNDNNDDGSPIREASWKSCPSPHLPSLKPIVLNPSITSK